MTSFAMLTNASASDKIMVLQKGLIAPYTGVLTPEDVFKTYEMNTRALGYIKENPIECEADLASEAQAFGKGVVIGALIPIIYFLSRH